MTTTVSGYLLVNGSIGTFTVGRAVSDFQVATDLGSTHGSIGTLTAGQWADTDLAAFAIGSITTRGFATPDLLPGSTAADFKGSNVVVNGALPTKSPTSPTSGIGSLAIGNDLDGDVFNVPSGIASVNVAGIIGNTAITTLDLLNPETASAGDLGSLTAGAVHGLNLYANQVGTIATKGNTAQDVQGDLDGLTLAIGFAGAAPAPPASPACRSPAISTAASSTSRKGSPISRYTAASTARRSQRPMILPCPQRRCRR